MPTGSIPARAGETFRSDCLRELQRTDNSGEAAASQTRQRLCRLGLGFLLSIQKMRESFI